MSTKHDLEELQKIKQELLIIRFDLEDEERETNPSFDNLIQNQVIQRQPNLISNNRRPPLT